MMGKKCTYLMDVEKGGLPGLRSMDGPGDRVVKDH